MANREGSPVTSLDKQEFILYLHNYSFYSQKVLMVLHEKGLSFGSEFVNIAGGDQYLPSYLAVNPKGEVPALKDRGKIIVDSARIINHLEERSLKEEWPLMVPLDEGAAIIEKHNHFHTLIHELPADVITIGSFYHQELVRRPKMPFVLPVRIHMKNITERFPSKLKKLAGELPEYSEELKKKAEKLEKDLAVMKNLEEYQKVLDTVEEVMKEVEEQLAGNQDSNRWLVSSKFTVADVDLTILLERLSQLGLDQRFWGSRPSVKEYFGRVKQRESYRRSMPSPLFHVKTFLKSVTYLQLF